MAFQKVPLLVEQRVGEKADRKVSKTAVLTEVLMVCWMVLLMAGQKES